MFEGIKEKMKIKKDLNKRYEILDNLNSEIKNKSVELQNLEENFANLQERLARLQSEIGPYESLEAIEKQRRELNQLAEEVGGYAELKEQVAKLKSEKDYLEDKKYDVKDIIFVRYNLIGHEEILDSPFIKDYEIYIDSITSSKKVIYFSEFEGIHKMIYEPYLGKSLNFSDESADVELIDFISYAEICSALGIELKGYLTYEEVINISNTFKSYISIYSLTDTLNEIRNSRTNDANMHR